jgi:FkbM family methyltransferase
MIQPATRAHAVEGPHAQFGEDRILDQVFRDRTHGYCVEVGAYDGRTGSATLLFENRGWQCLLVEPIPGCVAEIRGYRRCFVKHCAASSEEGETTFFVADGVEQMSTLELDRGHHRWIRDVGGTVREIQVRTARLDDLLDEVGFCEVQFITIDVEGHELAVLQGLSLDRFNPRIVILEENLSRSESAVARHMAANGYVNFKRTGVNDWYARESDVELVQAGAVRRFKRSKQIQRLQDDCARLIGRHLPVAVKRALANLVERFGTRG